MPELSILEKTTQSIIQVAHEGVTKSAHVLTAPFSLSILSGLLPESALFQRGLVVLYIGAAITTGVPLLHITYEIATHELLPSAKDCIHFFSTKMNFTAESKNETIIPHEESLQLVK